MLKWSPRVPRGRPLWGNGPVSPPPPAAAPVAIAHSPLRRVLDVVIAGCGFALLAPLWVGLALAVKLQDGGPVFYRARRVGQGGRVFQLYKFRTMVPAADRQGPGITAAADPRVTRLGRLLRRSKLDELPQLLNVLRGEMSLVGPRPEDPRYVALYSAEQRAVLGARPGITSAAALAFRHEESLLTGPDPEAQYRTTVMPAKIALDLAYLQRRTPVSDLGLICRTVAALFQTRPAGRTPTDRLVGGLLALRNRHFLAADLGLFLLIPTVALALRLDWTVEFRQYARSLLVATVTFGLVKSAVFYRAGLYTRFWRYASIDELAHIVLVGLGATVVQTVVYLLALRPLGWISDDFPRSLPLIDGLLTVMAVGGIRYSIRLAERLQDQRARTLDGERVLVVGAGEAGVSIVREMQSNPRLGLSPVGFIDDDPDKQRAYIRGVQVLGARARIGDVLRETGARQVIIAMPRAPGKTIREVVTVCEGVGVRTRIIPGMYEILGGSVSVNSLRNVDITDLLRREAVQTDVAAMHDLLHGKRVVITGGGGSIGSELCRQVLRCGPAALIILGHGENSLFEITNELRLLEARLPNWVPGSPSVIRPVLADIRFAERISAIFHSIQPEIVFHAAAHKHVPLMEDNPGEAITTNVWGTRNLLNAALAVGVARFVMLSTDKAVNPTSVMGASKRAAELLVHQAAQASGRPYMAVRFGNVLGSRGSVLHTFRSQIAAGGPLTVTHPEMQRFFMTIPEAVQLVLQAGVLGGGGEVFVLDMGEPVKMVDMARDLIALSGLEVGRDIDIVFTGMRPGEKLYEELFVSGEGYARTQHEKVFIATHAGSAPPEGLDRWLPALETAVCRDDRAAIIAALQGLIPEFQPVGDAVTGLGRRAEPWQAAAPRRSA